MKFGSSHVFSEIFIHLNWHCLYDKPMINTSVEPALFKFMEEHCRQVKGIHMLAVNGTPTHVHLAFQMEPFVTLSDFVGKIKGASSFEINKAVGRKSLQWQRGCGAVSFSKRQSRSIVEYIERQKEHHGYKAGGGLNQTLEISGVYDDQYDQAEHDREGGEAEAVGKPR